MAKKTSPHLANQKHVVKKNDKLEKIAKAYKHKKWKTIWQHPENKKLVSKRKKPDAIQPGDVLIIPPTEAQIKDAQVEEEARMAEFDEEQTAIRAHVSDLERSIKHLEKFKTQLAASNTKMQADLNKAFAQADKWATGVDVAGTVATLGVSLTKLAGLSYKAAAASGDALIAINKQATVLVAKGKGKQALKQSARVVSATTEGSSSKVALLGKAVAEGWLKMTKPSFWGWTFVQMYDGKSWSDAVTSSPKDELKKALAKLERQYVQSIRRIDLRIAATRQSIKLLKSEIQ